MNKKCLSIFISTFLLLNILNEVSFAAKKDVADPVLQEIIVELSGKMPKFINKYGVAVFVADEQITRGTLLQALYEYDKKSSSKSGSGASVSSVGVISKKDYDALNAKVLALEKKLKSAGVKGELSATATTKSTDITNIMEDLEVNMPMLLDNSLKNSKVFSALERKVNSSNGNFTVATNAKIDTTSQSASQQSLAILQKNIINLNKKVEAVELSLTSVQNEQNFSASSKKTKTSTDTKVLYDLKNLQKEINAMNEKISLMETKLAKSKEVSSVYSGPGVEDYAGLKKAVIQINKSYEVLGKRVDELEKEQHGYVLSANSSSSVGLSAKQMQLINTKIDSIRQSVDDIKAEELSKYSGIKNTADIKQIEKRLSSLEKSKESRGSYDSDNSSSGSGKTGTIAKISLGLSLIAALFIAR